MLKGTPKRYRILIFGCGILKHYLSFFFFSFLLSFRRVTFSPKREKNYAITPFRKLHPQNLINDSCFAREIAKILADKELIPEKNRSAARVKSCGVRIVS